VWGVAQSSESAVRRRRCSESLGVGPILATPSLDTAVLGSSAFDGVEEGFVALLVLRVS
jgi:hypothetical protein